MARPPEFLQIAARIRRDNPPSSPDALPGERDLARRYGVSRPTIRKALALLTQQGVLKRRARGAVAVTSEPTVRRITTVVAYVGPVSGPFHAPFLLALLLQASARGYHLRVVPAPDGAPLPEDLIPRLAGSHAVIGGVPDVRKLERACPPAIRLVLVGVSGPDPTLAVSPTRAIHVDLAHGMETAVRYATSFAQEGRVWVVIEPSGAESTPAVAAAHQRRGLGLWLAQMRSKSDYCYLSLDPASHEASTLLRRQFLATKQPTAIVCENIHLALIVREMLRDQAHTHPVHRALPIICLDNDPLTRSIAPELITFNFEEHAIAQQVLAACFFAPAAKNSIVISVQPSMIIPSQTMASSRTTSP